MEIIQPRICNKDCVAGRKKEKIKVQRFNSFEYSAVVDAEEVNSFCTT